MPTRRVWRYKQRAEPLTAGQWAFFMVRNKAGFDRLYEKIEGGEFFFLYYADDWRKFMPRIARRSTRNGTAEDGRQRNESL